MNAPRTARLGLASLALGALLGCDAEGPQAATPPKGAAPPPLPTTPASVKPASGKAVQGLEPLPAPG